MILQKISVIEGLAECPELESLYLCDNQIQRIEGLENLKQLTYVHLSMVSPPSLFSSVNYGFIYFYIPAHLYMYTYRDLNLARNEIYDISGLQDVPSLTRLDLSDNKIKDVGALSSLYHLTSLQLAGNQLTSVAPHVKRMTDLHTLNVAANPIGMSFSLARPPVTTIPFISLSSNLHVTCLVSLLSCNCTIYLSQPVTRFSFLSSL